MKNKKFLAVSFLFIAVVSLMFAVCCFTMDMGEMYGGTESASRYGADFYTDVQNAAAQAATNTYYIGQCIEAFGKGVAAMFGFAFVIVSLAFGSVSINMFKERKNALLEENEKKIEEETIIDETVSEAETVVEKAV